MYRDYLSPSSTQGSTMPFTCRVASLIFSSNFMSSASITVSEKTV